MHVERVRVHSCGKRIIISIQLSYFEVYSTRTSGSGINVTSAKKDSPKIQHYFNTVFDHAAGVLFST